MRMKTLKRSKARIVHLLRGMSEIDPRRIAPALVRMAEDIDIVQERLLGDNQANIRAKQSL